MDLSSYVVAGWVYDLDIVANLVFKYKDIIMVVYDDKLQRLLVEHFGF